MTAEHSSATPPRNAPCPCGSGKKYKYCCGKSGAILRNAGNPVQRVFQLYQSGNLQGALELALQQLGSQPGNAALTEIAAVAALQLGQVEQAITLLQRQIRLQPGNAQAHSNLCMALHAAGRDEEAYLQGQQALALDPRLVDAWNNLGNIFRAGNHLAGALEHYERALALDDSDPELQVNAGSVSQLLGDLATAAQRYRRALAINPQFAAAWNNLGTALQRLESPDDAAEAFHKALQLQPDNPEFLANYGSLLLDLNEVDPAKEQFERAIAVAPQHAGAWVSMGNLYDRLHDQDNARHYYGRALELDPENSTVLCNIGYQLFEAGEQQQSVDHFIRALKSNPNSPKALAGLGKAMLRMDKDDKAEEYINQALQLAPQDIHAHIANGNLLEKKRKYAAAEAEWQYIIEHKPAMADGYVGLATVYSDRGRPDDARALYRLAEQNGATSVQLYHAWSAMEEHHHKLDEAERLAGLAQSLSHDYAGLNILRAKLARRRKDYPAALALLRAVSPAGIDSNQIRSAYYFEMGAILDKLKRYPEAFTAYDSANQAKNAMLGRIYNADDDSQRLMRWQALFSAANWNKLIQQSATPDTRQPTPVFIVGFPRSGTSLLEQILGSHPEFAQAGELAFMNDIAVSSEADSNGILPDFQSMLDRPGETIPHESLNAMRDYYLGKVMQLGITNSHTRWVTDKMPHNAFLVGLIRLIFPTAPIIHISRHPLNSCLSAYFANFVSAHRYTSSLEATAQHYRNMMTMLNHYRGIGVDFLEVHYEDLVTDQENTTRKILEYIGAPWNDACLQHHKSDRVVKTASYEQVTQKIYTSSLYRYRNYQEAVQRVIPILADTIRQFGYSTD